jgi:hypothetical protein
MRAHDGKRIVARVLFRYNRGMTNRIALFTGAIMALSFGCEISPAQFREQTGHIAKSAPS